MIIDIEVNFANGDQRNIPMDVSEFFSLVNGDDGPPVTSVKITDYRQDEPNSLYIQK